MTAQVDMVEDRMSDSGPQKFYLDRFVFQITNTKTKWNVVFVRGHSRNICRSVNFGHAL